MFCTWKALLLPGEKYRPHTHSERGRQPHAPCWVLETPRSRVAYAAANPCPLARQQLSSQLCPTPTGAQKKPEPRLEQLIGDIQTCGVVQSVVWCVGFGFLGFFNKNIASCLQSKYKNKTFLHGWWPIMTTADRRRLNHVLPPIC